MNEEFLHFIWRYRLFHSEYTYTTMGDQVQIVDVGRYNRDAGPDFFDARVRINGTLWAGNVEIHLRASEWNRHEHQEDPAYNNVILHVVGEADLEVQNQKGRQIPCIRLEFPELLVRQYEDLLSNSRWIPCEDELQRVDQFFVNSWLDRVLVERLERKSDGILFRLQQNRNSWEETFYQHLARAFGMKVNADPFEQLAVSLPIKYLARQKNSLFQLESLFFGQSGLLDGSFLGDEYFMKLKEEYQFLRKKYDLKAMDPSVWKFLRLRPNNFPTVRIAQLAALVHCSQSLFSMIIEIQDLGELRKLFRVKASSYWDTHFQFNKISLQSDKVLGETLIDVLLINTVIPFLFVYGRFYRKDSYCDRAMDFLYQLKPERNSVIQKWRDLGVEVHSAFHTQSLLQLKDQYCDRKRCLECEMGNRIIRSGLNVEKGFQ